MFPALSKPLGWRLRKQGLQPSLAPFNTHTHTQTEGKTAHWCHLMDNLGHCRL